MNFEDLSGRRFGRLIVIGLSTNKGNNKKTTRWVCRCDCGNTKEIMSSSLKNGDTRSCGCLRRDLLFDDISGKRFSRLLVLEPVSIGGSKGSQWKCKCDCGSIKEISGASLKSGSTKSCGCLQRETAIKTLTKKGKELEHAVLVRCLRQVHHGKSSSKRRALMPISISIQDLQAQWDKQRGICPYTGWRMELRLKKKTKTGSSPCQASLDRIDSSRGYVPGNIQFVALMANYAKNSFDDEHLIHFCKSVSRRHPDSRMATNDEVKRITRHASILEEIGLP